ncbi:MAG: hypothetical protein IJG65_03490 [Synergistaceae bacterium]|nr:hypothetical protein [Synergistaceae bacterium]
MGGGVIFTECYTPAPDTPRSHGCLWSSNYPKFNGCNIRGKYPLYYMNDNMPNLMRTFRDNGYSFNIFEPYLQHRAVNDKEISPSFPFFEGRPAPEDTFSHGVNLPEYLKSLKVKDNSLTVLRFGDFHNVVDNYFSITKHVRRHGLGMSAGILECIRSNLPIDDFDLTVFYSDHGFKERDENFDTPLKVLGKARTRIMMFVRRKGDTVLSRNERLSSIMDVYPTVLDACGIPYNQNAIEGRNMFTTPGHDMLLFEDYLGMHSGSGEVDIWGVRTARGLACTGSNLTWEADYDITGEEKEKFTAILSEKASVFASCVKAEHIRRITSGGRWISSWHHYDGSKPKKLMITRLRYLMRDFKGFMAKAGKSILGMLKMYK